MRPIGALARYCARITEAKTSTEATCWHEAATNGIRMTPGAREILDHTLALALARTVNKPEQRFTSQK